MSELHRTLQQLTLVQHLLGFVFLLSYVTALGSMFGPAGRLRAFALALLAAAGFAAQTHPWEQGVLLVMCAIGGIGLFIAVAWAFSAIATSDRWMSGRQASMRSSSPPPELCDAATRAVARAAHAVKRRRHHRTT
jgi:hypothetical protein